MYRRELSAFNSNEEELMMKVKLLKFNKYGDIPEKFEAKVNDLVSTLGKVHSIQSQELDDGSVVYHINHTDEIASQHFGFLAYLDTRNAEEILNNTLSHLEEAGNKVSHVHLAILSKAGRMHASILYENILNDISDNQEKPELDIGLPGNPVLLNVGAETQIEAPAEDKGQEGQQDKDLDEKPDDGTKRTRKRKNRRDP